MKYQTYENLDLSKKENIEHVIDDISKEFAKWWSDEGCKMYSSFDTMFMLHLIGNTLVVKMSNRMTSSAGYAYCKEKGLGHNGTHLQFSTKLFNAMTNEQRYETIVHEFCHLAQYAVFPKKSYGTTAHDTYWVYFMTMFGFPNPRVYHDISIPEQRKNKLPVYCNCDTHYVTHKKYIKIANHPKSFYCKSCRANLRAVK